MSFLDEIMRATRRRVDEAKGSLTTDVLEQRVASMEAARDFEAALRGDGVSLIAEIKRASPLKGDLSADLNAAELADAYRAGGAAALSVLTEPEFFRGSLEDLERARSAGLPVLRKDFVIDSFQLLEARAAGADAVLLIVRIVRDDLEPLLTATRSLGMDALVEVHDEGELDVALEAGSSLVGINHRDLATFEVDPARTQRLAGLLPSNVLLASLSGVSTRAEVESLGRAGAGAVLVGESLVTASDPAAKLRELTGVGAGGG
jgi:indole-3-glycerol phosphate synthase